MFGHRVDDKVNQLPYESSQTNSDYVQQQGLSNYARPVPLQYDR